MMAISVTRYSLSTEVISSYMEILDSHLPLLRLAKPLVIMMSFQIPGEMELHHVKIIANYIKSTKTRWKKPLRTSLEQSLSYRNWRCKKTRN